MQKRRRSVLYVVQGIPGSNAPTKHAFAIADLMNRCGFDASFLLVSIIDPSVHAIDKSYDYPFEFPCELMLGRKDVARKYLERTTSFLSKKVFTKSFNKIKPDMVVYYGIESPLARSIVNNCHKSGIPVLVDETDWFDAKFNGDFAEWIIESSRSRRVERVDPFADGIIAISPFFVKHFEAIRQNSELPQVFFLPPLNRLNDFLRLSDINVDNNNARRSTKFFYAGSPAGEKDQLAEFISAIVDLKNIYRTSAEFHIVGISPLQADDMFGDTAVNNKLFFYGRKEHSDVIKMLRTADFGILFRRPERYARAGFSTKFAECMSNGVPMICNAVGGADLLLDNKNDGIIVPDCSRSSIEDALSFACNLTDFELMQMKKAALDKALRLFSQESYVESFSVFLNSFYE